MRKNHWQHDFTLAVQDLTDSPELQRLRTFAHHRRTNRYDHTLRVAKLSFRLARRLGLDERATARAAMLHDLFYHDNTCRPEHYRGSVLLNHPEEALRNARKLTPLSQKEENIILSHMWPLSRHAPHCGEAWLVDLVDDVVAVHDYLRKGT